MTVDPASGPSTTFEDLPYQISTQSDVSAESYANFDRDPSRCRSKSKGDTAHDGKKNLGPRASARDRRDDKEIVGAVPNHACLMQLKLKLTGREYVYDVGRGACTARALDAAIGFLALYEDIQEEVYNELRVVMSNDGKIMMKTDMASGLSSNLGQYFGLHLDYNPKYFPDPEEFRPRGIGRKFAVTEGVAFLSNLLGDWRLEIMPDPDREMAELAVPHFNGASTLVSGDSSGRREWREGREQ
ncbi:hypothetical protein B0H14DRAFT_2615732 [Mycena olivaceomarginata]|nr:hypothetical protein B0H14DRAFT_2615732 [Mycena olivaceomarginata]